MVPDRDARPWTSGSFCRSCTTTPSRRSTVYCKKATPSGLTTLWVESQLAWVKPADGSRLVCGCTHPVHRSLDGQASFRSASESGAIRSQSWHEPTNLGGSAGPEECRGGPVFWFLHRHEQPGEY